MKIKNITLSNFSKYDQVDVSFDENVTYLIGKNGSGKSTLGITAIWFMFQGIAEKASDGKSPLIGERFRFIGPKAATAKGEMTLYDERTMAEIRVIRKLTKSGTEVSFEGPEGLELGQKWLTDLFNVFLISPKMFCELSPKGQANALGIDTDPFDKAIAALKLEHTSINREINAFGKIEDLEEIKEVDIQELQSKKDAIREKLNKAYQDNKAANKATRDAWEASKKAVDLDVQKFNEDIDKKGVDLSKATVFLARLGNLCMEFGAFKSLVNCDELERYIDNYPPLEEKKETQKLYPAEPTNLSDVPDDYQPAAEELVYIRELPDDKELRDIDAEIAAAGETNKKALLYSQHLEKKQARSEKESALAKNRADQAGKNDQRTAYIKGFKFPFSNISVGEDGELLLAGKPIKEPYFSTGEILKAVPILLSTSNPDLKYVFLQDFNLMDEDKQAEIEAYLTGKGFQLVVEMVGKQKIAEKNCILLRDNIVVEDYETANQPSLSL